MDRRNWIGAVIASIGAILGLKATQASETKPTAPRPLSLCIHMGRNSFDNKVIFQGIVPNCPTHGWWSHVIGNSGGPYITSMEQLREATPEEVKAWIKW